jgi:hypothetical protein
MGMYAQILSSAAVSGDYLVSYGGDVVRQTTDQDRATFGIPTDQTVKDAMKALYGKAPNDVFYTDPTKWDDANYRIYGWPPLSVRLVPQNAEVTDVKIEAAQIFSAEYPNNTDQEIEGEFDDTINRSNTQATNWSQTQTLSVSEEVGITIGFFGSKTNLSYQQAWQKGGSESSEVTLGSRIVLRFPIPPHETRWVTSVGFLGTAKITITYAASLTGIIYCNYSDPYAIPAGGSKHHFYGIGIENVLNQLGKPNQLLMKQTIDVTSYAWQKTSVDPQQPSGPAAGLVPSEVLATDLSWVMAADPVPETASRPRIAET